MPFTFSHPAVILPLLSKRLKIFSATGLVIGSIIPDFESFIKFGVHKHYSHSWAGMFWFDLPLGIIAAFVFHNIVRDPLINNLPDFLKNKCTQFIGFQWNSFFRRHFIMVICSLLIGIALHLLWDAFTHLNLANPDAINSGITIYHGRILLYKALQDANSILGLVIVIWYVLRLPANAPAEKIKSSDMMFRIQPAKEGIAGKFQYWGLVLLMNAITVAMGMTLRSDRMSIVLFIDILIAGWLAGIIVAPILQRLLFPAR